MKVDVEITGLDGVIDMLRTLPASIASRRGGPLLAALKKGATVIRKEEVKNLRRATSNQTKSGEDESTGLLVKSLTVRRGRMPPGQLGEKVIVGVRKKTYTVRPDGMARSAKGRKTTVATAQLLEYGSNEQPAESWIRPAFQAKAREAIRTVESSVLPAIDKAVQKHLNAMKGK